jgi:hypothetical protein
MAVGRFHRLEYGPFGLPMDRAGNTRTKGDDLSIVAPDAWALLCARGRVHLAVVGDEARCPAPNLAVGSFPTRIAKSQVTL